MDPEKKKKKLKREEFDLFDKIIKDVIKHHENDDEKKTKPRVYQFSFNIVKGEEVEIVSEDGVKIEIINQLENDKKDKLEKTYDNQKRNPELGELVKKNREKPLTEMYEHGNQIVILSELHGIEKKNIRINIMNDKVEIIRKKNEDYEGAAKLDFNEVVKLPVPVSKEGVKTNFRNGILEIKLNKIIKNTEF